MITLDKIDLSDAKSGQRYEDLLRKRFHRIGYHLSKGKAVYQSKGFRIANADSGSVVAGENYDLSIQEAEKFWLDEYNRRYNEKRTRRQERADKMRPKTVKIDNRWAITNDKRAIRTLNDHIAQYGNFDANGHGDGGDIATVMYQAYRPYTWPRFNHVWSIDGDYLWTRSCLSTILTITDHG